VNGRDSCSWRRFSTAFIWGLVFQGDCAGHMELWGEKPRHDDQVLIKVEPMSTFPDEKPGWRRKNCCLEFEMGVGFRHSGSKEC
jgi:hypothetical protein